MKFCRSHTFPFRYPFSISKISSYRPTYQPLYLKSSLFSKRYTNGARLTLTFYWTLFHLCISSLSEWHIYLVVKSYSLIPSIPRILTVIYSFCSVFISIDFFTHQSLWTDDKNQLYNVTSFLFKQVMECSFCTLWGCIFGKTTFDRLNKRADWPVTRQKEVRQERQTEMMLGKRLELQGVTSQTQRGVRWIYHVE